MTPERRRRLVANDLALWTALHAQVPAYGLLSPKAPYVGQSEMRARRQQQVFKELAPALGFIDEVSEAIPMQRGSQNLDSGASDAVAAEFLSALADSSRAGRTLLIAASNCPWRIGSAMASRFIYIPVLQPLAEDFPDIVCAIASRLAPEVDWQPGHEIVSTAAAMFHKKGANARTIRSLFSAKLAEHDDVSPLDALAQAAVDCAPLHPRDRAGADYADLYAISVCTDLSTLPWAGCIAEYPVPSYLDGIIRADLPASHGHIDRSALYSRLAELEGEVNV